MEKTSKKISLRMLSVVMAIVTLLCMGSILQASASTLSELQSKINQLESQSKQIESQINTLKSQKADQAAVKAAIESKIANTQQQINLCNNEINKINTQIANNKAEIQKKNDEIDADKLAFKKRIRALYMSDSDNSVQILMGADSFSDYLQLSQLTAAVSAHDKVLIENIVAAVKVLEQKLQENESLLAEQVSIKKTIDAKQQELLAEQAEVQSAINSIAADQSDLEGDNASVEAQIKKYQKDYAATEAAIRAASSNTTTYFAYDGGAFQWPVPGYYGISAGYASNDSVHNGRHYGIDIAGGGISGKPVVAIADGVVTKAVSGCTHNYGKSGSCGCGGGYGNYVVINHGTSNGSTYSAWYAHMASLAVGNGAQVKRGQVIGYVGSTGWSTGFHLHLGIMVNGGWVNPMNFYSKVQ